MATSKSTVIVSAIVLIAIVAIIAFIFLLFVFLMTQFRRVSLNNSIKKLLENENNDQLQVNEKRLGKMYQTIKKTWERREALQPIPDTKRILKGWMRIDENTVICIRDEIIHSPKKIEEAAIARSSDLARKPYLTMQQYFQFLINKKIGHIRIEDCDTYLSFYDSARYGSPSLNYNEEDYAAFSTALNSLLSSISR